MKAFSENQNVRWLAAILAGLLGIGAVIMGAYMTLQVMKLVLPESLFAQYMALTFFDGGALGWAGTYIYLAKGSRQRAISFWLMWYDLAGVVAMVIGEILLGGQTLTHPPLWLGQFIVGAVIVTFAANLVAWYYYHQNKPELQETIEAANLEDKLADEAMQQARARIEREAQTLGAIMARRATARIKYRLSLPMSEAEAAEWQGQTIEATAEDLPALPHPMGLSFWEYLKSFFGRGRYTLLQNMPSSKSSSGSTSHQPEEVPFPVPQEQPGPQV